MSFEFVIEKCPKVLIPSNNYMTASATITTIRTSLGNVLLSMQVYRTLTSASGRDIKLNIVYKITFSHDNQSLESGNLS
jgi:hypothetical protein